MKPAFDHNVQAADPVMGSQRWLTTFNDMITLLMVFFVLLFSMGSLDLKRFAHFQNALQSAMGVLHEGSHAPVGTISDQSADMNPPSGQESRQDGIDALKETPGLEAEYTPRGIQLILDDHLLFASGSDVLTPGGGELLGSVARIIRPIGRHVRVEGHTDNVPIANLRFASNWELSIARAIQVVKYLAGRGGIAPEHLAAAGYGQSRPRVDNDSLQNRSKNRRVEIMLGPVAASPKSGVVNKEERRN